MIEKWDRKQEVCLLLFHLNYNWERRKSAKEEGGICGNPNKIDTQKDCQFGYFLFDHLLLELVI